MIKIERKETPHTQEAMDDLQEACDTGRSYNTEHVNRRYRKYSMGNVIFAKTKRQHPIKLNI